MHRDGWTGTPKRYADPPGGYCTRFKVVLVNIMISAFGLGSPIGCLRFIAWVAVMGDRSSNPASVMPCPSYTGHEVVFCLTGNTKKKIIL